jgi:hypothetical protein
MGSGGVFAQQVLMELSRHRPVYLGMLLSESLPQQIRRHVRQLEPQFLRHRGRCRRRLPQLHHGAREPAAGGGYGGGVGSSIRKILQKGGPHS